MFALYVCRVSIKFISNNLKYFNQCEILNLNNTVNNIQFIKVMLIELFCLQFSANIVQYVQLVSKYFLVSTEHIMYTYTMIMTIIYDIYYTYIDYIIYYTAVTFIHI